MYHKDSLSIHLNLEKLDILNILRKIRSVSPLFTALIKITTFLLFIASENLLFFSVNGFYNLKNTILKDANLEGANLQGAIGLTSEQVKQAKSWEKAIYSPEFFRQLKVNYKLLISSARL